MWNLIVSVPDHCLSFYFGSIRLAEIGIALSMESSLLIYIQY